MRVIDSKKFIEKLLSNATPHSLVQKAREEYEAAVRVLEVRCRLYNREATEEEIRHCVNLKLQIDAICADWIEDKL